VKESRANPARAGKSQEEKVKGEKWALELADISF